MQVNVCKLCSRLYYCNMMYRDSDSSQEEKEEEQKGGRRDTRRKNVDRTTQQRRGDTISRRGLECSRNCNGKYLLLAFCAYLMSDFHLSRMLQSCKCCVCGAACVMVCGMG